MGFRPDTSVRCYGNTSAVETYLNNLSTLADHLVSELLGPLTGGSCAPFGEALYRKNNIIIALINLFIREHNIKTTKMDILAGVYQAECRVKYTKARERGCLPEFMSFDEIDKAPYIREYWHLMD